MTGLTILGAFSIFFINPGTGPFWLIPGGRPINSLNGSKSSFLGRVDVFVVLGELTTRIWGVVGVAGVAVRGVLGLGVVVGLTPHRPNTQPPTFLPIPSAEAGLEFAE